MLKTMLIVLFFFIFIIGGILLDPSEDIDIDYWMGGW